MKTPQTFSTTFAGQELTVEVGKIALHTNASCTVRYGDTVILATAVMSPQPREGLDYFPLMVDYEEKMYASGKIKGSRFIKREGRPPESAIITGRMIDRGLRPLFPAELRNDVQVILTVLSSDGVNDPGILAINAASLVLHLSDIPWNGPLAGVRIGRIDGKWVLNPQNGQRDESDCDITFSSSRDRVAMFEAEAQEITADDFYAAVAFGMQESQPLLDFFEDVRKQVGLEKVSMAEVLAEMAEAEFPAADTPAEAQAAEADIEQVEKETYAFILDQLDQYLFNQPVGTKRERKTVLMGLKETVENRLIEQSVSKEMRKKVLDDFDGFIEAQITKAILERDQRVDGRSLTDIRSLACETGLLPRTHGSALFSRGETQVLSTVTLGSPGDEQLIDTMDEDSKKRYMHHYNDAPYSYGETGPLRGPGRRAIGHGNLAEKALLPVLPGKEEFPYTIRVVSEVMSSNGSSSMASTCGSTLALMDAGVPIKRAVAGIAMGIAQDDEGNYKILTDLQDLEDGEGGMDFKITGTRDGITAVQMDTKSAGLTLEIIQGALTQGREALMRILDVMEQAIGEPRTEMSPYAPRIISIKIDPDKIRDVIGPGGKMINEIIDACGVDIDIEDDGYVFITGVGSEGPGKAKQWVENIVKEVEAGEIYEGTVTRTMDFGAFVEILPKQEGLVHISEISTERTDKVTDVLNIGDKVKVIVKEIDDQGRINLSIKRLDPDWKSKQTSTGEERSNGKPHSRGKKPFFKR